MVDVEAYELLHPPDEANDQAQAERGDIVTAYPNTPGFEDFLCQLPSTIYGFRMDDKSWGMTNVPLSSQRVC